MLEVSVLCLLLFSVNMWCELHLLDSFFFLLGVVKTKMFVPLISQRPTKCHISITRDPAHFFFTFIIAFSVLTGN